MSGPLKISHSAAMELQKAAHAALEKGVPRAYKFEYASPVDGQDDFFILAQPSTAIIGEKVVVRINAAQALALASQICQTMAIAIMSGSAEKA